MEDQEKKAIVIMAAVMLATTLTVIAIIEVQKVVHSGAYETTAEVLRGIPYTTEYDYALESVTEPVTEEMTAVTESETCAEQETEEQTEAVTEAQTEPFTESVTETVIEAETEALIVPDIVWTDMDETCAVFIAKTLYGECRACAKDEIAAVAWCILNRVDSKERYFPDDVIAVITQPYQFLGYREDNPVREDLLDIARDVLRRWYAEKNGAEDVGRVLPKGYCFFTGDGLHNYFTTTWKGSDVWDWTLQSPYTE